MARSVRIHYPGAIYHVFSRGIEKRPIFFLENQWHLFMNVLKDLKAELRFQLFALCLMPNHFHLLIQVDQIPLSTIMQRLKARFALNVNLQQQRVGPLFQGRYGAKLCRNDSYLLTVIRYIHLNPVSAGLATTPDSWPWSGHHDYIGSDPLELIDCDIPLALFAARREQARVNYQEFLRAGLINNCEEPKYLDFENDPAERCGGKKSSIEAVSVNFDDLLRTCLPERVSHQAVLSGDRSREVSAVRRLFILSALKTGRPAVEIAAYLGCHESVVSRLRSANKSSSAS